MKTILYICLKIVGILALLMVMGCEKDEIPATTADNCDKVVQGEFVLVE